jgi:hypothetical protein
MRDDQRRPVSDVSSGITVRNLAPSIPLIPRSVRRHIAAKNALDILLGLLYPEPTKAGFSEGTDYEILASDNPSSVVVSYQLPGTDLRVELKPLPHELFD